MQGSKKKQNGQQAEGRNAGKDFNDYSGIKPVLPQRQSVSYQSRSYLLRNDQNKSPAQHRKYQTIMAPQNDESKSFEQTQVMRAHINYKELNPQKQSKEAAQKAQDDNSYADQQKAAGSVANKKQVPRSMRQSRQHVTTIQKMYSPSLVGGQTSESSQEFRSPDIDERNAEAKQVARENQQMLSAQVGSKDYSNYDMVLNDEEPKVEQFPQNHKRTLSRNKKDVAQVLNQQYMRSSGRSKPAVANQSTKVKQAFSYLTEKRQEASPVSRKRQSTFATSKYKNNLIASGATTKNATSFVDNSVDKLGESRTNVSSVQRKRVAKGDRKTMANPTHELSQLTVASKKKYIGGIGAGTTSFNNQVRERPKPINSTIATPRGSSSLLKSISMSKLSRPRAVIASGSGAQADHSIITLDKNRSQIVDLSKIGASQIISEEDNQLAEEPRQSTFLKKHSSNSVQRAAMMLARKTEAGKSNGHRRRNDVGLKNDTVQINAHKFGFVRGATHGLTSAAQTSAVADSEASAAVGKRHATSGHRMTNEEYQTQLYQAASANKRVVPKIEASIDSVTSREYEDPKGVTVGEANERLKLSTIDFGSRGLLAEWRDSSSREHSQRAGSYVQSARQYGQLPSSTKAFATSVIKSQHKKKRQDTSSINSRFFNPRPVNNLSKNMSIYEYNLRGQGAKKSPHETVENGGFEDISMGSIGSGDNGEGQAASLLHTSSAFNEAQAGRHATIHHQRSSGIRMNVYGANEPPVPNEALSQTQKLDLRARSGTIDQNKSAKPHRNRVSNAYKSPLQRLANQLSIINANHSQDQAQRNIADKIGAYQQPVLERNSNQPLPVKQGEHELNRIVEEDDNVVDKVDEKRDVSPAGQLKGQFKTLDAYRSDEPAFTYRGAQPVKDEDESSRLLSPGQFNATSLTTNPTPQASTNKLQPRASLKPEISLRQEKSLDKARQLICAASTSSHQKQRNNTIVVGNQTTRANQRSFRFTVKSHGGTGINFYPSGRAAGEVSRSKEPSDLKADLKASEMQRPSFGAKKKSATAGILSAMLQKNLANATPARLRNDDQQQSVAIKEEGSPVTLRKGRQQRQQAAQKMQDQMQQSEDQPTTLLNSQRESISLLQSRPDKVSKIKEQLHLNQHGARSNKSRDAPGLKTLSKGLSVSLANLQKPKFAQQSKEQTLNSTLSNQMQLKALNKDIASDIAKGVDKEVTRALNADRKSLIYTKKSPAAGSMIMQPATRRSEAYNTTVARTQRSQVKAGLHTQHRSNMRASQQLSKPVVIGKDSTGPIVTSFLRKKVTEDAQQYKTSPARFASNRRGGAFNGHPTVKNNLEQKASEKANADLSSVATSKATTEAAKINLNMAAVNGAAQGDVRTVTETDKSSAATPSAAISVPEQEVQRVNITLNNAKKLEYSTANPQQPSSQLSGRRDAPDGAEEQLQDKLNKAAGATPRLEDTWPMTPQDALKFSAKQDPQILNDYEMQEILSYDLVYYMGQKCNKKVKSHPIKLVPKASDHSKMVPSERQMERLALMNVHNYGYDDANGELQTAVGDHIGYRFEIQEFIGSGSFGQALKCLDHRDQKICAVKVIRNKQKFQYQAGMELKILKFLNRADPNDQNNIIRVQDYMIFREHLIISFELLSVNLYDFLKQNNFQGVSQNLIRRFAIQILQALKFQADHHLVHCDLKPENILLKQQNKSGLKLIDYGSSCFMGQRIYTYIQSRFYRAPEIILGVPYTTAIDMWSFGAIISEMFSGFPLFPGESEHEQLAYIMELYGVPPKSLLSISTRGKIFFKPDGQPKLQANSRGKIRQPSSKRVEDILQCNDKKFIDFLNRCFEWDPIKRMTPLEGLQHPWILEGLPQKVLKHHCRMFGGSLSTISAVANNSSRQSSLKRGSVSGPAASPAKVLPAANQLISKMTHVEIQGFPKDKRDLTIHEIVAEIRREDEEDTRKKQLSLPAAKDEPMIATGGASTPAAWHVSRTSQSRPPIIAEEGSAAPSSSSNAAARYERHTASMASVSKASVSSPNKERKTRKQRQLTQQNQTMQPSDMASMHDKSQLSSSQKIVFDHEM